MQTVTNAIIRGPQDDAEMSNYSGVIVASIHMTRQVRERLNAMLGSDTRYLGVGDGHSKRVQVTTREERPRLVAWEDKA